MIESIDELEDWLKKLQNDNEEHHCLQKHITFILSKLSQKDCSEAELLIISNSISNFMHRQDINGLSQEDEVFIRLVAKELNEAIHELKHELENPFYEQKHELKAPFKVTSIIEPMMGFAIKHPNLVAGAIGFTVCLGLAALAVGTMGLGLIPGLGAVAAVGATVGLSSTASCAAGVALAGVAGGVAGVAAVEGKKLAKFAASRFSLFASKEKDEQPGIPKPLPGPV